MCDVPRAVFIVLGGIHGMGVALWRCTFAASSLSNVVFSPRMTSPLMRLVCCRRYRLSGVFTEAPWSRLWPWPANANIV